MKIQDIIEKQANKSLEFVDLFFDKQKKNVKEADNNDLDDKESKVKSSINELKNSLLKCKSEKDLINVIEGLKNILKKNKSKSANEAEDKNHQLNDQILKLLNEQQATIEQLQKTIDSQGKKIDDQDKKIKKLKGTIFSKVVKTLMKWGTIVLMVGVCGAYVYNQLPDIAQKAVKAEIIAVKDDINMIKDIVQGNTQTINKITDEQVKKNKELAQQIEKNREEVTQKIDGIVSTISKVINMFKSNDQVKADHKKNIEELNDLINQWKSIEKEDSKTIAQKLGDLVKKTTLTIDKAEKEEVDSSVNKTLLNIKIGIKDITTRLSKPTNESYSLTEFNRQKKLVETVTIAYSKNLHILTESMNKQEAQVHKAIYDIWNNIQKNIKNPDDVKRWYFNNKDKLIALMNDGSVSYQARKSLKKAFKILSSAIEGHANDKSFIHKHWLKILVVICYLALFIVAGFAGVGAAAASTGTPLALSNTEVLVQFLGTGWAFVWRAFLGMITAMGIGKLIKWALLK